MEVRPKTEGAPTYVVRVYFSERATFLIIECQPGANAPYVAFFNAAKAKKQDGYDVAMFVTSAHLRPNLPERLPAVTFATLIDYCFKGKPMKRPAPRRIVLTKRKQPPQGLFPRAIPRYWIPSVREAPLPLRPAEPLGWSCCFSLALSDTKIR
jgi:hypothetical protein